MLLLWLHLPLSLWFLFFASQHSGGILFPLRQLHGNRLGDFFASFGLFPQNVFWFCCPGNPHRTYLSRCIQIPGCICLFVCVRMCTFFCFSVLNQLVSKTLWSEEDAFTGVWHDDHFCIPSLWLGRRHQTIWLVHTYTDTFMVHFMTVILECFFSGPTGIMSILFAGIVMSHYTHHNLSPVTQILMQQTLRTVAFMCGQLLSLICLKVSCVFVLLYAVNAIFLNAFRDMCVCLPRPLHLQLSS